LVAEPVGAAGEDGGDPGERLDVVDKGGASEEAVRAGERRLVARLGAAAFDRLQQGGLLAADVAAGADEKPERHGAGDAVVGRQLPLDGGAGGAVFVAEEEDALGGADDAG